VRGKPTRHGDPAFFTLKILGGNELYQLLARHTERRYYEVPWPVVHYGKAPGMDALVEADSATSGGVRRSGGTAGKDKEGGQR
jgi:hypothetical protein